MHKKYYNLTKQKQKITVKEVKKGEGLRLSNV